MKICHLMTRFVRGGATRYIQDLIENIEDEHHLVCGPASDIDYLNEIRNLGVDVRLEKFLKRNNPLLLLFSIISLYSFFRREEFDIVHTNSTPAGLVGRIAGKLSGCKVVHTVHAVPFENRPPRFVLAWLEKFAALFSDVLIDVSPRIKLLFIQRGIGRGKHVVIPVGIDVNKFSNAKKTKIGCSSKSFKVLTAARLVKGKGVEDLMVLGDGLHQEDFCFLVAGDGSFRDTFESVAEDNIHFTGFREDMEKIMKSCDVFILLSEREGTPLVIYEAMAAGLPVIAKPVGGIPDQIEDGVNGFLVSDIDEARDRLLEIYNNDKLRKKLSGESKKKIKHNTVEKMVRETKKVYESLVLK